MTKICPGCARELEDAEFNFKRIATGKRTVYCRTCSRRYVQAHYANNKSYYLAKARKRNDLLRAEGRARLLEYLLDHPCVDCGENDPVVLQFDHVDPSLKRREVTLLIRGGLAWARVEAEIAKCEIRCANCHLRRTAQQFGWYRSVRPDGLEPPTLSSED